MFFFMAHEPGFPQGFPSVSLQGDAAAIPCA